MITKKQLLDEYALACYAVVELTKIIETDETHRDSWLAMLVKRDTLGELLKRYFDTSEKEFQHILDLANNANYHL